MYINYCYMQPNGEQTRRGAGPGRRGEDEDDARGCGEAWEQLSKGEKCQSLFEPLLRGFRVVSGGWGESRVAAWGRTSGRVGVCVGLRRKRCGKSRDGRARALSGSHVRRVPLTRSIIILPAPSYNLYSFHATGPVSASSSLKRRIKTSNL